MAKAVKAVKAAAKDKEGGTKDVIGLGEIAKAASSTANKRLNLEEVKTEQSTLKLEQRETTERKRIEADVKLNEIAQKYATKRHDQIVKQATTFINESDNIINSLDNTIYKREWKLKRGGKAELKISAMSFMLLTGYFGPMIGKLFEDEPVIKTKMETNSAKMLEYTKHLVDHSENLHRIASAGSMSFNAPEYTEPEVRTSSTAVNWDPINESTGGSSREDTNDFIRQTIAAYENQIEELRRKLEETKDESLRSAYLAQIQAIQQKIDNLYAKL